MNRSTPGLPVHHQLPEFTQTHVHGVGDAIQPSHPLSSPSLPALNPSQHQSLLVISPLISSSILGTYWPADFYLSVSYHFALSYCSWGSQGKNTEVVCHSLLQWTTFCQTSPPWPTRLRWPHMTWLSFIELDKAVVLVWFDWLVFCDYGFSVSALWCPLATPTILLGFLLPWAWGISSRLLQQSAAAAPYLGRGLSPHRRPSWPWTWNSSSRPSCACAATAPWMWGSSSQPLPLA